MSFCTLYWRSQNNDYRKVRWQKIILVCRMSCSHMLLCWNQACIYALVHTYIYALYFLYLIVENQPYSALGVKMHSANQNTASPVLFENSMTEATSRPLVTCFHVKKIKAAKVFHGIMGICLADAISAVAFWLELTFLTIHTHQCQKLYQVL